MSVDEDPTAAEVHRWAHYDEERVSIPLAFSSTWLLASSWGADIGPQVQPFQRYWLNELVDLSSPEPVRMALVAGEDAAPEPAQEMQAFDAADITWDSAITSVLAAATDNRPLRSTGDVLADIDEAVRSWEDWEDGEDAARWTPELLVDDKSPAEGSYSADGFVPSDDLPSTRMVRIEVRMADGRVLGTLVHQVRAETCEACERCTWNPGPDCGRADHAHCPRCGHCQGRHA